MTQKRERRIPDNGKPLHLAWPSGGEAAVAVEGLGTLGVSGSCRRNYCPPHASARTAARLATMD